MRVCTVVCATVGVVDGSIIGELVASSVIAEVVDSAVLESLKLSTLSTFIHPLDININAIIKVITSLFFITLLFLPLNVLCGLLCLNAVFCKTFLHILNCNLQFLQIRIMVQMCTPHDSAVV